MAVTDGKTRKARRHQADHLSPKVDDPVVDPSISVSSQIISAPPISVNPASLEESFQEIALADSGKVMLNVFDADPTLGAVLGSPVLPESSADGTVDEVVQETVRSTRIAAPPLAEFTGTKELLFRLIQSDYFDAWIGLNYLWKYNGKDVGLQYFLCERLRERPMSEIEFVLPQIWYFQSRDYHKSYHMCLVTWSCLTRQNQLH